ncbi:hypothetical protein [Peribacillus frigoritolerans]|uniref:hypothetical protein n=1 Tax=Peribacillus frigoritolerans TaxID=450367 RepID=UPI002E234743|nr:hypothetical protein [Peribacillus frigoritolerans]
MNKHELIDLMTGVKSSKKTYYTELKKTVDQLKKKKNMQLEIMNDITVGRNPACVYCRKNGSPYK